jgi:hypothetical protein
LKAKRTEVAGGGYAIRTYSGYLLTTVKDKNGREYPISITNQSQLPAGVTVANGRLTYSRQVTKGQDGDPPAIFTAPNNKFTISFTIYYTMSSGGMEHSQTGTVTITMAKDGW